MNRWIYIILLLLGISMFAYGQTQSAAELSVAERNAALDMKDAFWDGKDCVAHDSEITSECLGWYTEN